jgi:hypothetical protein
MVDWMDDGGIRSEPGCSSFRVTDQIASSIQAAALARPGGLRWRTTAAVVFSPRVHELVHLTIQTNYINFLTKLHTGYRLSTQSALS